MKKKISFEEEWKGPQKWHFQTQNLHFEHFTKFLHKDFCYKRKRIIFFYWVSLKHARKVMGGVWIKYWSFFKSIRNKKFPRSIYYLKLLVEIFSALQKSFRWFCIFSLKLSKIVSGIFSQYFKKRSGEKPANILPFIIIIILNFLFVFISKIMGWNIHISRNFSLI